MKKRLLAMLLVLVLIVQTFAGCGKSNDTVSMGNWLAMITDAFGMYTYVQQTPYFADIDASNPYFAAVQTAVEWEAINPSEKIDLDKAITYKQALITLVNLGEFVDIDKADDEKIDYAINNFDNTIKKNWMKKKIGVDKALNLIAVAVTLRCNRTYDPVCEYKYGDNVVNLAENDVDYELSEDLAEVVIYDEVDLRPGDIFSLGAKDGYPQENVHKVFSAKKEDGKTIVKLDDDNLSYEEFLEEGVVRNSFEPDMSDVIIEDADGNIVSIGSTAAIPGDASNLMKVGAPGKKSLNVDLGNGYKAVVSWENSGKLALKVGVSGEHKYGKSSDVNRASTKVEASYGLSNFELTHDFTFKGFKLKRAELGYTCSHEAKVKASYKGAPWLDVVEGPKDQNYTGGIDALVKNFRNREAKINNNDTKGAKTIKLCKLDIKSVGIASLCLDVELKIGLDGSVTVSVTNTDAKRMIYKNGNISFIDEHEKKTEAEILASIRAGFYFGLGGYALGLKKRVIGVGVEFGLGVDASQKMTLVDAEMHYISDFNTTLTPEACIEANGVEIREDAAEIKRLVRSHGGGYTVEGDIVTLHAVNCTEFCLYAYGKATMPDCMVNDLLSFKWEYEFLNKDKGGRILTGHAENFDFANSKMVWFAAGDDLCSLKFTPYDELVEEALKPFDEEVEEDKSYIDAGRIVVDRNYVSLDPGTCIKLAITGLPEGYTPEDIITEVSAECVTIDSNLVVTGHEPGGAMITFKTKDDKYYAYCAVIVKSDENKIGPIQW